jgi:D-Tyr-tRNA(Tyr) deacylase
MSRRLNIMRTVIQRVSNADMAIAGAVKATIQNGLLILSAIEDSDTAEDIECRAWPPARYAASRPHVSYLLSALLLS